MIPSLASAEKGMADVGRCLLPTTIPPRQPRRISDSLSAQPAARLVAVSPGWAPRGGAITPRRRRVSLTPVAAPLVAALLPAGAPGGHVVERVGSDVTAIFLHLGRRPAKNADQNIAEFFGSVAPSVFGVFHVPNMERSDVPFVASAYVTERE